MPIHPATNIGIQTYNLKSLNLRVFIQENVYLK